MPGQPQVIVTLQNSSGKLQMELPGANGYRRKVEIKPPPDFRKLYDLVDEARMLTQMRIDGKGRDEDNDRLFEIFNSIVGHAATLYDNAPLESLKRILQAQATGEVTISTDGAPTAAQVNHWENHGIWPDDTCPFCRDEGRISSTPRKIKPSEILDAEILALDKAGAGDWQYRQLLPKNVPPLEKKSGQTRAETWHDRALARRLQLRLKEAGVQSTRRKLYPGATKTSTGGDGSKSAPREKLTPVLDLGD